MDDASKITKDKAGAVDPCADDRLKELQADVGDVVLREGAPQAHGSWSHGRQDEGHSTTETIKGDNKSLRLPAKLLFMKIVTINKIFAL